MAQSGPGIIEIFEDFLGPEVQVAANMEHSSATGALWNLGQLTIKGQNLDQTDAGAAAVEDGLNGVIYLTSSGTAGGDSIFVCTETCLKPSVNAPMILEVRCETSALTARRIFVGFCDDCDDAQTTIVSGTTATLTYTEGDVAGFLFDSGLTTDVEWHYVHSGGTTTAVTTSTDLNSGVAPVAGDMDVLRVEIDNNGTARWFINGELKKTLAGAVSTSVVFAAVAGVTSTATTATDFSLDYFLLRAARDWTV